MWQFLSDNIDVDDREERIIIFLNLSCSLHKLTLHTLSYPCICVYDINNIYIYVYITEIYVSGVNDGGMVAVNTTVYL